MPTAQWLGQWKSNLFWSVLVGAVVGLLTNIGSSKLMEQIPRVSVATSVSYNAGETVADVVIYNSGDLPLRELRSQIQFERAVTCSVLPRIIAPTQLSGDEVTIQSPPGFVLASGGTIDVRCISAGRNDIVNKVADVTTARAIVERQVIASARHSSQERVVTLLLYAALVLLAVLTVLVAALLLRSRNKTTVESMPRPNEQVLAVASDTPEERTNEAG